ncbi:MAG: DoxX family membrane protein, partial [Prevotellaceae bacterium]|nr:DoxX family membrane protein [Prevotellaceae bacterium]
MQRNRKLFPEKGNISVAENVVLTVVRLLLGCVFIFSGFVKAVDPLGTAYKFQEYFAAFGDSFTHFNFLALPFAIVLIAGEFVVGVNLIFKIYVRTTSFLALLFMLVMTGLTLWIYIMNPVTDCGCFGDALVISNSATFWKNVVLLAFAIYLFIRSVKIRPLFMPVAQIVTELVFIAAILGFMVWNLSHLPVIDFRPYKIGVNIEQEMQIPQEAPADVYDIKFIYSKDGV